MAKKSSPQKKAKNARSWVRGEAKKKARNELQKSQELENKIRREDKELTLWEQAKLLRKVIRAANSAKKMRK